MQKAIWVFMYNTFYTCLLCQNNVNVSFFLLEYKVFNIREKGFNWLLKSEKDCKILRGFPLSAFHLMLILYIHEISQIIMKI